LRTQDNLVRCTIKGKNFRAIALDGKKLVEEARKAQGTWPTATAALGRLLIGAALFTSFLEDESPQRVCLHVVCNGPLHEIFAEADAHGRVRGYVANPYVHLEPKEGKLDVKGAVGEGTLHVIKDLGIGEPYCSSIPLISGGLALDLAYHLVKSEQTPSAMALGVMVASDGSVKSAGGLLVHTMGDVEEEDLTRVESTLNQIGSISHKFLDKGPVEVLTELFHPWECEMFVHRYVEWGCPCSRERAERTLIALGSSEIKELIKKGGTEVECRFCGARYRFSADDLKGLIGH